MRTNILQQLSKNASNAQQDMSSAATVNNTNQDSFTTYL